MSLATAIPPIRRAFHFQFTVERSRRTNERDARFALHCRCNRSKRFVRVVWRDNRKSRETRPCFTVGGNTRTVGSDSTTVPPLFLFLSHPFSLYLSLSLSSARFTRPPSIAFLPLYLPFTPFSLSTSWRPPSISPLRSFPSPSKLHSFLLFVPLIRLYCSPPCLAFSFHSPSASLAISNTSRFKPSFLGLRFPRSCFSLRPTSSFSPGHS